MTLTEAQFRNDLVKTGIAQVGHLYRDSSVPTNWPPEQFDCSVFMHWLNAKHGVNIDSGKLESLPWPPPEPRPWHKYQGYTLDQQYAAHQHPSSTVAYSSLKPGDRLYYDKPGEHHVVMFIGNNKVVHAAGTDYGVIISALPGTYGFGGKSLTMCVSATRFAMAVGYKFSAAPPVVTPPPVKPPTALPTVFMSHILSAIAKDGPAAQGHTTYKAEVLLVESGLQSEGLLAASLVDGSAGTASFGPGSAYQKWQVRLGYTGADADGVPGVASLTTLGKKHGFNVV